MVICNSLCLDNRELDESHDDVKDVLPKYLSLRTAHPDEAFFKNYQLNKQLIKAMAEYCKDKHIKFMLATVDITSVYNPEGEEKYKDIDPTFNANFFEDDLKNYASSFNIDYLGLQRTFSEAYINTGVPLHWIHWNYEGHKVVANALAEKLKPILASNKVEYSALAYYGDHQTALERDIENRLELSITQEKEAGISPLIERLKTK